MSARERIIVILGTSLVFNVVLLVLLVRRQSESATPQPVAQLVEAQASPTVTNNLTDQPMSEPTASPTAVILVTPTSEPSSTPAPSSTPIATPEVTATPEATATPEMTATLVATAMPEPTFTPIAIQGPDWLTYLNQFRQQANLAPVVEDLGLSVGSGLHSSYMVQTDQIHHYEEANHPLFTMEGDLAAGYGNLVASVYDQAPYQWAIEYWISAPFHAVPILDPRLHSVGFGLFREATGGTTMAAVMDVQRGVVDAPPAVTYPIPFPKDGGQTWVIRHSLYEYPDPYTSCPGYVEPSGPPIILQLGSGDVTPHVTSHSFRDSQTELEHCIYDETTYVNPDAYAQQLGRVILGERDAIILLPRAELKMEQTYTVNIVANGQSVTWSFTTVPPPWKNQ